MVKSVIIKNNVTNEQIELKAAEGSYIIDSIDWDSPSVEPETYRVPYQIGETYLGTIVGTRQPVIIGYIVADIGSSNNMLGKTWEQYYSEQEQVIGIRKQDLNRIISIYQDVQIRVGDYYLDARPSSPVLFSSSDLKNNEVLCQFTINLTCYKSMFYTAGKATSMAEVKNMARFPMVLTESSTDEHLVFGSTSQRTSYSIQNNGDVDVGCIIKVTVVGGAIENFRIYNITNGDSLEFEGINLANGDVLTINTNKTEESAVIVKSDGSGERSVVGYTTADSKFLQIVRGNCLYSYDFGEEEFESNPVEISIEYTEQYFNFPGM